MPEHKFEFTVTGYELSEDLKHRIAADIAAVVSNAIVAHSPGMHIGSVLIGSRGNIRGGRLLDPGLSEQVRELVNTSLARSAAESAKP